jgi:hypothetical protein
VAISAARGVLTFDGKAIGGEPEAEAPKGGKPATVVNFPKGT